MPNPFIEKAEKEQIRARARKIAERNFQDLLELLGSYNDGDNQEARERIRLRVVEAREAVDHFA